MKKNYFLSYMVVSLLLAGCAHDGEYVAETQVVVPPTLVERVQGTVTAEQKKVLESLPSVIDGMEDKNGIADYEKAAKGKGYSRTYEGDGKMLTFFIGNNTEFGIDDGITPAATAVMEKVLKELDAYSETGLYRNVKIDEPREKEMVVSGVKYSFLRTTASFELKGERKITYIALIPSKKLMSYVRVRLTYPASFAATKLQNTALKTVMRAVSDFE